MAEGTNDCTISFGNEIAMLRIMIDACMDRVNWLVEDIGSNSAGKPPPPDTERLSTKGIRAITDAAYEVYAEGGDPTDTNELVWHGITQHVRDGDLDVNLFDKDTDTPDGNRNDPKHEGRQCGINTLYPPMAEQGPTTPTTLPALPDDFPSAETKGTDTDGDNHNHKEDEMRRDGTQIRATGKTGLHSPPNVQEPHIPQPTAQHTDRPSTDGDRKIDQDESCSCCDRTSSDRILCEPCGQLFHRDCTRFAPTYGATLCQQCIADHTMIGAIGATTRTTNKDKAPDQHHDTIGLLTQPFTPPRATSMESETSSDDSSSTDETNTSSFSKPTRNSRK
jgi:hypothetical protein